MSGKTNYMVMRRPGDWANIGLLIYYDEGSGLKMQKPTYTYMYLLIKNSSCILSEAYITSGFQQDFRAKKRLVFKFPWLGNWSMQGRPPGKISKHN